MSYSDTAKFQIKHILEIGRILTGKIEPCPKCKATWVAKGKLCGKCEHRQKLNEKARARRVKK